MSRCTKTPGVACVRQPGHSGCCTACPSARTLDWDEHYDTKRREHEHAAEVLSFLDFETPRWADLLD